MTKFVHLVFAITIATTLHFTANSQSVSINTTGATADPSAILDVTSTAKGMLVPRMDKTQKNAIATPANGLMVYQTGPDSIGFHYYDLPNTQWIYINTNGFASDSTAWKLTGNNNVVDTSFLGSINNKALKFRVFDTTAGIVDSTSGNTGLGYKALRINTNPGFYANTAIGFGAGENLTSGYSNTAMGRNSLAFTNGSIQNVAIGDSAMGRATLIAGTTAIGFQALKQINGLSFYTFNTAVGYASQSGPTGTVNGPFSYYNTSVGGFAMADNMAGFDNTAIGVSALRFNDSSSSNTAIGINAMAYHKRSGFNSNVAVGSFALETDSIGFWNTVVGAEAMQFAKNGGVNTAIGFRSMRGHKVGGENTAVGVGSLEADSSGTQNTAVGRSALFLNKAGTRNTVIGAEAGVFNNLSQTNPLQGSENTYVGFNSGRTANIGRKNAVLGAYALEGSGTYGDQPTLDAYSRNSVVGDSAALRTFGNDNVAMGFKALNTNAGGSRHVAIGSRALESTTATYPNTAVGYFSMDSITTGFANTALGSFSLSANKAGFNNVAVGNAAMFEGTAGNNNTAVGNDAGRLIKANQNTAIGSAALRNDSTGTNNVAIGYSASFENDTASFTTAIGTEALFFNTLDSNVAIGFRAGYFANSNPAFPSKEQTFIGTEAGMGSFATSKNTAIGFRALTQRNPATGSYTDINNGGRNTAIGDSAMAGTIGISNVAIGALALSSGGLNLIRNVAIGDSAMSNASTTAADDNVAVGYKTLSQVRNHGNTAMGTYAGQKLTNTVWNTAIGYHALETDTTGSENTVVGTSAFRQNANGIRNASLGINTGFWITGSNNTFLGSYAGEGSSTGSTTASSNTAVGFVTLRNIRSGTQNTALGEYALTSDTSGSLNVAVGAGSMENHLRGNDNVAMGFWAGRQDTASERNIYIGRDAGYSNQRDDIIAIGYQALFNNSNGAAPGNAIDNTAIGRQALRDNTSSNYNVAIGNYSQFQTASALGFNTSVGANTLYNISTGGGNTVVGSNALPAISSGSFNTALGTNAMFNTTTGGHNVGIGYQSLFANNSGRSNTAVGKHAGYRNTTGNRITVIGDSADVASVNLDNASAIGYRALVGQNNSMVLGSINGVNSATASTNVGIGTTTPDSTFSVADNFLVGSSGTVQYDNSVPVMNYMFKSGGSNADRMVVAHSPAFANYGLEYQDATDKFNFLSVGTEVLTVDLSTQRVGIDNANPADLLHVGTTTGARIRIGSAESIEDFGAFILAVNASFYPTTDGNRNLGAAANRWNTVYATVGAINTSDARDKENITNLNYGLNEIMKLRPVTYNWKDNPQWGKKIGFIAQEVQPVLGEVVQVGDLKTKTPSTDADANAAAKPASDKLGIYYSDIIPVTVKAIQEQQQLIINQQKTIDDLLKRIEKLEKKN